MKDCGQGDRHPAFVVTYYPNGVCDLSVCWDSTNVREIATELRAIADGLDELPEDHEAKGVAPLYTDDR